MDDKKQWNTSDIDPENWHKVKITFDPDAVKSEPPVFYIDGKPYSVTPYQPTWDLPHVRNPNTDALEIEIRYDLGDTPSPTGPASEGEARDG